MHFDYWRLARAIHLKVCPLFRLLLGNNVAAHVAGKCVLQSLGYGRGIQNVAGKAG